MFFYQISTLTTGKDEWTGGAQNDMFTAPPAGVTNQAKTFTTGDILDGGDGDDTLILDAQGAVITGLQTVKNIENLKVYESAGWTGDVSEFAGLKNVEVTANGAVTLTTGVSVTDVTVMNPNGATGAAVTTTLNGDSITDVTARYMASSYDDILTINNTTADHTLNVALDKVGTAATSLTIVDAAAETIALTSNGLANNATLEAASAALKNIVINGKGDLTLTAGDATATTIDGAKAEGDLTLGTLNATTATITTGAGDDSFTTGAIAGKATINTGAGDDKVTLATGADLTAGSTITLGDGNDTLTMDFADLTKNLVLDGGTHATNGGDALIFNTGTVTFTKAQYDLFDKTNGTAKGFEVVGTSGNIALTIDDASKLGVNSFYLENATTTSAADISNASNGATITFADNTPATTGGTFAASELNMASGTVNATINVNLEAGVAVAGGSNAVTVAGIKGTGVGIFKVTSASEGETAKNVLTITSTNNNVINVLGDHDIQITNTDSVATDAIEINATGLQAKLTLVGSAAKDYVKASAFGDTITGGGANDDITLGAGKDTVIFTGSTLASIDSDSITGFHAGAGGDILAITSKSDVAGSIVAALTTNFIKGAVSSITVADNSIYVLTDSYASFTAAETALQAKDSGGKIEDYMVVFFNSTTNKVEVHIDADSSAANANVQLASLDSITLAGIADLVVDNFSVA